MLTPAIIPADAENVSPRNTRLTQNFMYSIVDG